jgi:PAT family beta-lactamase induction signal transducer AmpG
LLTALFALARTVFAMGAGYIDAATGWMWYFAICAAASIPSFILLVYLQSHGHFARLGSRKP